MTQRDLNDLRKDGKKAVEEEIKHTKRAINLHTPRSLKNLIEKLEGTNFDLEELLEMGLNGIEVSHPDVTERAAKLATHAAIEYNLYISGGTDHTGPMSACDAENARPAYHGVTMDEYRAIKERRFG